MRQESLMSDIALSAKEQIANQVEKDLRTKSGLASRSKSQAAGNAKKGYCIQKGETCQIWTLFRDGSKAI